MQNTPALITRQSVFKKYPTIAAEIAELQRLFFDPEDLEYFENEEERLSYYELFDAKDLTVSSVAKSQKIISFEYANLPTFAKTLASKLIVLLSELQVKNLVILAHLRLKYVGNPENDYPPLQEAFKKLNVITRDVNYKEAIEVNTSQAAQLIEIAFWIERCDPSGPEYIVFYDENEQIAFYLCKNGNVHLTEFHSPIISENMLSKLGWYTVEHNCQDKFSADGAIEGRQLRI